MAKKSTESLFGQLTRLFKSGPVVRRKVRQRSTEVAAIDPRSNGNILLSKSANPAYSNVMFGMQGYAFQDRLARLQDFAEMELTAEISTALDIYADESVAQDANGRTLHIYSDNPVIKKRLDQLFYETIDVENNLRPWTRNVCKYGDAFAFVDVSPSSGVQRVLSIHVNEMQREEGTDSDDPMATKFRWMTGGNRVLENWEVLHFRLLGNDQNLPYGTSVLDGARRIWRQLIMIEDAMLVYRITRAPDRRVFYVDVGGVSPDEVENYVEQAKRSIRSSPVVDRTSGRVDLRYNPFSTEEDFWIPTRGGEASSRIDVLPGGTNTGTVEDVAYIQRKLIGALKVPKAYLGYEDALASKSSLAQQDIRFSRTINMIQRSMITELNKLAVTHLFVCGFSGEDLLNFELRLSNPSTIAQQQKLELVNTKLTTAASVPENLLPKRWIYKNIIGLTDRQILELKKWFVEDVRLEKAIDAAKAAVGGGDAGEGGDDETTDEGVGVNDVGGDAAPAAGDGEPDLGLDLAGDRPDEDLLLGTDKPVRTGRYEFGDLRVSSILGDEEVDVLEGEESIKLNPIVKKRGQYDRRNKKRRAKDSIGLPNILTPSISASTNPFESVSKQRKELLDSIAHMFSESDKDGDFTVKPVMSPELNRIMERLGANRQIQAPSVITESAGHDLFNRQSEDAVIEIFDDIDEIQEALDNSNKATNK